MGCQLLSYDGGVAIPATRVNFIIGVATLWRDDCALQSPRIIAGRYVANAESYMTSFIPLTILICALAFQGPPKLMKNSVGVAYLKTMDD